MKRYLGIFFFLAIGVLANAQDVPVDQLATFNGRYSFTMLGASLNSGENNNGTGVCPSLVNPTSANLSLAAGQTVQAAFLYWSASKPSASSANDTSVTLNGSTITADQTFTALGSWFACRTDITGMVQTIGNGTYTFDDLNRDIPGGNASGCYAGWSIIVIYEDPTLTLNTVYLYDGFDVANGDGNATNCIGGAPNETVNITLNGLNVVNSVGATLGFIAWEGDNALDCEDLVFGQVGGPAPVTFRDVFDGISQDQIAPTTITTPALDMDIYDISSDVTVGTDQDFFITLQTDQDQIFINAVAVTLNNELPDATVVLDNIVNDDCDDRVLHIDYTVGNIDATDILPAGTSIRFYIDNFAGTFLAEDFTSVDLPIGGSEMRSINLTIPAAAGQDFDIYAIVNDDGSGNRILLELDPNNNDNDNSAHIIEPSTFAQSPVICEYETFELPDGSFVNTASTYTTTLTGANADGCDSVVTTTLTVNPRPLASPASDQECSDTNTATFDLTDYISTVNNGATGVTVTFHPTPGDAEAGTAALPNSHTTASGSVFARVVNDNTTCINTSEIVLTVNPNPEANDAAQAQCSDTDMADFNLGALVNTVDGGIAGRTVTFHTDQALADSGGSPLSLTYNSGSTTIFARVVNDITGCFSTSEVALTVNANPTVNNAILPLVNCSSSGTAEFTLSDAEAEITGGATDVTVTFHLTPADATSGANTLPNNHNSTSGTVHTRVTHNTTMCFATGTLELTVIDNPPNPTQNIPECSSTGEATFDISTVEDALIAGIVNVSVTFHSTINGANTNTDLITNTTAYTTTNTTVYARVQADYQAISCHEVAEVNLIVNPNPTVFTASLDECSDGDEAIFTLSNADSDVTGGQANRTVKYYETMPNAVDDIDELVGPYTTVSTTVFAKVINDNTSCESITDVQLNVVGNPVIPNFTMQQCYTNQVANFDLGGQLTLLEADNPSMDFSFHPTSQDAIDNTNPLPNIFPSENITIYLRIELISSVCFSVQAIDLETIETPQEDRKEFYCLGDDFVLPDGTIVSDTGIYTTTIIQGGCDYRIVTDLFESELDFPSAFTPNSNGENDCFRALPGIECRSDVTDFTLKVFNRWGELVWTANDYLDCWDGQWQGAPSAPGFYLWWATYTFQGAVVAKEGGVTLIR